MTFHSIRRAPIAPAPTLEDLAAHAVRLGREVAAVAREVGVGVTPQDWLRVERLLEALGERAPFEAPEEDLAEAQRILGRHILDEETGTERRVIDRDYDDDGREYPILGDVTAYSDRGHALIEVQERFCEFVAARDRVLDSLAAERSLQSLRRA